MFNNNRFTTNLPNLVKLSNWHNAPKTYDHKGNVTLVARKKKGQQVEHTVLVLK